MTRVLTTALVIAVLALPSARAEEKKDNTPPSGFKALFDGKDLDGWQGRLTSASA